jgi:hypothetical protein
VGIGYQKSTTHRAIVRYSQKMRTCLLACLSFFFAVGCGPAEEVYSFEVVDNSSGSSGNNQGQGGSSSGQGGMAGEGGTTQQGGASGQSGTSGTGGTAGSSGSTTAGTGGTSSQFAVRYPAQARHSPLTESVIAGLRTVLQSGTRDKGVFSKVGASNTVNTNFAHCFAGTNINWDTHSSLEDSRVFFNQTKIGSTSSFDRDSLSAVVGWGAGKALEGSPSALDNEITATNAAFAVVLFGTNDTYTQGVHPFADNLIELVRILKQKGVIALLTTIPPRGDTAAANALVPEMNAIIRAVSQAEQVPMLDLWQNLVNLPAFGLAGDGIHLQVYSNNGAKGCFFTAEAMQFGMNHRNLITMEALDRMRTMVLTDGNVETPPPALVGAGTWDDPRIINEFPFVDDGDTTTQGVSTAGTYACGSQDESGPEIVYQVTIEQPTTLHIRVFDDPGVDIDLHWLTGKDAASCIARNDKYLEINAMPGTYRLVTDTFVSGGSQLKGKYRLTVVPVQ